MAKSKRKIIFYIALLSIYFILTAAAAFIFEYYTVTVTKGKIIFSLSMSWQLILFAAELVTIILQEIMLILSLKKPSRKRYMAVRIAGAAAGAFAIAAVIYLAISDGLRIYPTLIFFIYMALIVSVRAFFVPRSVKKLL